MTIKFIPPSTITIMIAIFLSYGAITAQAYETTDLVQGCANKYEGYDAAIDVCSLQSNMVNGLLQRNGVLTILR